MSAHPNSKNPKNPKENPKKGKIKKKQTFWKPVKKMSRKILQAIIINMLLLLTMITNQTPDKETYTKPSRKKPRKMKSTQNQRHWKIVQKTTSYKCQLKSLIITGIIKHLINDLYEGNI